MFGWARSLWQSARARNTSVAAEVVLVVVVTLVVQVLAFHGYYDNSTTPSGDFLGPYNNEAFAWWRDGGILNPPEWMPYVWGGYPAVASIQNSGWYLPTGLASLFGYDIHTAASLQAVHVAFAGIGVYLLGRRVGFGRSASIVGLVAYSLSTGFFSNAPYIDIVRGHAYAPWLLLCLSPMWPWHRRWSIPVAALILWQAAVGVYPGLLVAFAYAGVAWALVWQLSRRPALRQFLLPLAAAGVIAVLLSMPKYLPLTALGTFDSGGVQDLSVLPQSRLGTFLLPSFPGLPGIYTMESFFLPAAVLLLALLANLRDTAVRAALVVAAVAVAIAVPVLPLRDLMEMLPGIGASRFRLNDFRPFILLPLVIAAMSGFNWLVQRGGVGFPVGAFVRRVVLVLVVPVAAAAFLVVGRFDEGQWKPTTAALGLTVVTVVVLLVLAHRRRLTGGWVVTATTLTVILTAASGLAYSRTNTDSWGVDSMAAQGALWGVPSAELIAHREDPALVTQRPARALMPEEDAPPTFISAEYNSGYYTGIYSVGGYINVHGSAAFVEANQALADPVTAGDARAWLSAPGIVMGAGAGPMGLPAAGDARSCADTGGCGAVLTTPISYEPGHLVYEVEAMTDAPVATLVTNEPYYVGWSALLVDDTNRSVAVEPRLGPAGTMMLDVPHGTWRLSITYRTPLAGEGRALAILGLLLVAGSVVVRLRRRPDARDVRVPGPADSGSPVGESDLRWDDRTTDEAMSGAVTARV